MKLKLRQRAKLAWNVLRNSYSGPGYDFTKWFSPSNIFSSMAGETLASNETIFAAITRLSNSMAVLPLKLYKEFTPVNSSVSDLVANAPNRNMTSFDFIRALEVHRNSTGNGYALKMYDRNYQVEALLILDPARVTPVIEKGTQELWYEIDGENGRYFVHNLDMIHVKHIHSTSQKGISPIDVLRNTVDFDGKVKTFSLEQMDVAIKASFILKMAAHLGPDKRTEILDNFKAFYKDNGGVLIQEAGMEINPIERNVIDTKIFEVEKITRTRVASVFNMPVHMLGETDGKSYSSMEQMALEFVQGTMLPIVRMYEQEFNRKLLTPQERQSGLYFKFNMGALLRADMATQLEALFKGVRSAIYKPNEARAYLELPPEPDGEKLYLSGDLYPIDAPLEQRKGVKKE